jgi:hypothetical protein
MQKSKEKICYLRGKKVNKRISITGDSLRLKYPVRKKHLKSFEMRKYVLKDRPSKNITVQQIQKFNFIGTHYFAA